MDGYTATKSIKEQSKSVKTVIIALTASAFENEREKILEIGCDDFMNKPFQEQEIFDKLAQYLGVKYVYEVASQDTKIFPVETLSPEDLSTMSPQWLEQMYQAAYYLDTEAMNELITQIPESKVTLSKALIYYVNNFDTDRIMELIRYLRSNPFRH